MASEQLTAAQVWAVLVEEVGARPEGLAEFEQFWPCPEFRFIGSLGFGGKVRARKDGQAAVDYYPEDYTAERELARKRANERLLDLLTGGRS